MPEISVIIPIYKAEATIDRCIGSIQKQSFQDFEIICVFDGIFDKSLQKVEAIALKDNRIKIAVQENNGVSIARNKGIDLSKGVYIAFVDSDDDIEPDYLESLYAARNHSLVICGHRYFYKGGVYEQKPVAQILQMNTSNDVVTFIEHPFANSVCGKMCLASIIKNNNIRFSPKLQVAEDNHFFYEYITYCTSVCFIESSGYNYYAPVIEKKYQMNAAKTACHLRIILTQLKRIETTHKISLEKTKKKYIKQFSHILLRYVANIDNLHDFMKEITAYKKNVPSTEAYSARILFRYLESSIIFKYPFIGFFIRKVFR